MNTVQGGVRKDIRRWNGEVRVPDGVLSFRIQTRIRITFTMSSETSAQTAAVKEEVAAAAPTAVKGEWKVSSKDYTVFAIMSLCILEVTANCVLSSVRWVIIISTEMSWERSGRSVGRRASGTEVLFSPTRTTLICCNRSSRWFQAWDHAVWHAVVYLFTSFPQFHCTRSNEAGLIK